MLPSFLIDAIGAISYKLLDGGFSRLRPLSLRRCAKMRLVSIALKKTGSMARRERCGFVRWVGILLLLGPATDAILAPQQAPLAKAPSVIAGFDQSSPGQVVSVPLILDVPEGFKVGRITSEITFPAGQVVFQEAKPAPAGELAGAKVNATVAEENANPQNWVLTLVITADGKEALRSGVVANLDFKISEKATVGESIKLKNVARMMTNEDPPRSVDSVESQDGEIQISETPPVITSCFFYMH